MFFGLSEQDLQLLFGAHKLPEDCFTRHGQSSCFCWEQLSSWVLVTYCNGSLRDPHRHLTRADGWHARDGCISYAGESAPYEGRILGPCALSTWAVEGRRYSI